jgi:hypothetical protein
MLLYPRESVATNEKLELSTLEKEYWLLLFAVYPLIFLVEIVAEFFAVAVMVHCAVDLYRTNFALSPVNATVAELTSTTVPVTVGLQALSAAVALNVHVCAVPTSVELLELL